MKLELTKETNALGEERYYIYNDGCCVASTENIVEAERLYIIAKRNVVKTKEVIFCEEISNTGEVIKGQSCDLCTRTTDEKQMLCPVCSLAHTSKFKGGNQ